MNTAVSSAGAAAAEATDSSRLPVLPAETFWTFGSRNLSLQKNFRVNKLIKKLASNIVLKKIVKTFNA